MAVQPLYIKDAARLEVVRKYQHSDPTYYQILNRPLVDLAQRTADINLLCAPARGLRVRATDPASATIEVEVGYILVEDGVSEIFNVPQSRAAVSTHLIAAAAGGKRRIDLVYYNMDSDASVVAAGTEVLNSVAWADVFTTYKAKIPSNAKGALIPLAYLYVDDSPTFFNHSIAINNAGHIRPCMSGPGMDRRIMNDDAANHLQDYASGGVPTGYAGVSQYAARADHRHPLNLNDATTPSTQTIGAGTAGGGNNYARVDHVHEVSMETDASQLKKDTGLTGALGARTRFVPIDHQHAANYTTATAPANVTVKWWEPQLGTSDYYSRSNHRHRLDGVEPNVGVKTINLSLWRPAGVDPNLTTSALLGRPVAILWWLHHTVRATNYGYSDAFGGISMGFTSIVAGSSAYSACWGQVGTNRSGSHTDNSHYHSSATAPYTNKEILAIPMQPGNNGGTGWHNWPDGFTTFILNNIPTPASPPDISGVIPPGFPSGGAFTPPANPQITGTIAMFYLYQRVD